MIGKDELQAAIDLFDIRNEQNAFLGGIEWFVDNLWHKPEEIPEANTTILYEYPPNAESKLCYATMEVIWREYYSQYIAEYPIRRWCYINDLIDRK